jgi:hypothetical protein
MMAMPPQNLLGPRKILLAWVLATLEECVQLLERGSMMFEAVLRFLYGLDEEVKQACSSH